jgi:uncharacterized protein (DUF362 family)
MKVIMERCKKYDSDRIYCMLKEHESIFSENIVSGDSVILKPNWIAESHRYRKNESIQVITNGALITAVLQIVAENLKGRGRIVITDGPQTSSSWDGIMRAMPVDKWQEIGNRFNVDLVVTDLREDEWTTKGDVIVKRKKLPGDPCGSTVCNLKDNSEFIGKNISKYGYFGADYDKKETNDAHSNGNHIYKVSKSVLEADVFINLPKLKTHKKTGMTCSLKNLVGINTYKNWLPHHTEGTPLEGGDQFPVKNFRSSTEGPLVSGIYNFLSANHNLAWFVVPMKRAGKIAFGDTRKTIRNGSWYGNDTLWRTVLDLNKILFYANGDGSLRADSPNSRKRYLSIVDAIVSGEGNGPDSPDVKETGMILIGTDPVSVDAVCAKLMGFDWEKIPIIKNSFNIEKYKLCDYLYGDIFVLSSENKYNKNLMDISKLDSFSFSPPIGWKNYIENN